MTFRPSSPRPPMKRGEPLKRSRMKPKRRTAADVVAKFEREYGSAERVMFVASLPCLVVGWSDDPCEGEIENAHVVKGDGGMGYKASSQFIAPACTKHHRELHRVGAETFQRTHTVCLHAACAETAAAWERANG